MRRINKKKIAVFVPVRLKSKRLELKALKLIGKQESIKWCLYNSLRIKPNIDVFLLTSYLKQDDKLVELKLNKKIKIFHTEKVLFAAKESLKNNKIFKV